MIVVTGGAGHIGSALIAGLNGRGVSDILAVDALGCDARWKNLRGLSFADYIEKDDFLQMVIERRVPRGIEAVLHMGACSDTTERDASYLVKNNYEYTKVLARWASDDGIRFIYASSAATYGDGSAGFSDDEGKIGTLVPLNMYGYSKQMFDLWAKGKGLSKELVGLKYFNVFGPNEYHKGLMRSFVLKAYEQARDTGKVRLFKSYNPEYGDGEYVRDFVYVKDAVAMTLFFLDHPKVAGLFNVGTGKARTWNDLVKAVFAAMGRKAEVEFVEMPESIRNQYQYFTQAQMGKLRAAGYKHQAMPLEDAVEDYVKNYLVEGNYLEAL
jgi:ADP-L-glycero-D-manno-heptose 6-epimerase